MQSSTPSLFLISALPAQHTGRWCNHMTLLRRFGLWKRTKPTEQHSQMEPCPPDGYVWMQLWPLPIRSFVYENPRATRHTSTQSNICSSVAMSSSRSLSSCWLSSAGDKILFDWTASRPEPSDRMSCSFCLDWGNDEKRRGRDDEMKRKEAGFADICWFDQKASLPTCCEINAWMSSPSGRKSIQLRPDSLHKEPTVLWLCGDQMKFRHKITPLLFEMTCSIWLDSKKTRFTQI